MSARRWTSIACDGCDNICRCGSDGMGDDAAAARRHVKYVHHWVRREGKDYCPDCAATPPVASSPVGGEQHG